MASIQRISSQVIDYAERLSQIADAAEGKHSQRTGRTTRWLLLPASGAALYAILKSNTFSRQAKGVMDEAKARASELPEDLLARVRQTPEPASSQNGGQRSRSTATRRKTTSASKTRSRRKTSSASR
jgi:hypothetical protein